MKLFNYNALKTYITCYHCNTCNVKSCLLQKIRHDNHYKALYISKDNIKYDIYVDKIILHLDIVDYELLNSWLLAGMYNNYECIVHIKNPDMIKLMNNIIPSVGNNQIYTKYKLPNYKGYHWCVE